MKILLHICCAPCAIYPLQRIKKAGHLVVGMFYNPNIHPYGEYKARKNAVDEYARNQSLTLIPAEYQPAEFFRAVNLKEAQKERCMLCWQLRLKEAAKTAKEKLCDVFTTTLLVSPYQDQEALKRIGQDIEKEAGVRFYYEDFRPGFRKAHEEARTAGIYCQKYCGCVYSDLERSAGKRT